MKNKLSIKISASFFISGSVMLWVGWVLLLIALTAIPVSVSADLIKPIVTSNSEFSFATYIYDSILSPANVDLVTESWECKVAQTSVDQIGINNDITISWQHMVAPHLGEIDPGSLNTLLLLNVDRRDKSDQNKLYIEVASSEAHPNRTHRDIITAKYEPIKSESFFYSLFIWRMSRLTISIDHLNEDKEPTPLVVPKKGPSMIIVRWVPVTITFAVIAVITAAAVVLKRRKL